MVGEGNPAIPGRLETTPRASDRPQNAWPVPILMYHRVDVQKRDSSVSGHYVSPKLLDAQMTMMGRLGYTCFSLAEVVKQHALGRSMPEKSFAITFDDGFLNFHTNALPVLERHGYQATVFLVSDLIGKTNVWNECEGDVVEPLMGLSEIADSHLRGTHFGSHTRSHADLSAVDDEQLWTEIGGSKNMLEEALGREVPLFCYPYGRYRPGVPELVKQAGYLAGCSCHKGGNTPDTDPYLLRRVNVRSDTSPLVLAYKLLRAVRFGR